MTSTTATNTSLLLEQYCTIIGIKDDDDGSGKGSLNGQRCLVVRKADCTSGEDGGYLAVLLVEPIPPLEPVKTAATAGTTAVSSSAPLAGGGLGGLPPAGGGSGWVSKDATAMLAAAAQANDKLASSSSTAGNFVSVRPENLQPIYGFQTQDSVVGGKGLFATRAYATGEIVFEERPFITVGSFDEIDEKVQRTLSADQQNALSCLTMADPSALPQKWRGSEWVRRFANNCITCVGTRSNSTSAAGNNADDDVGLYPVMCRINHSCLFSTRPQHNVRWAWDKTRCVQYLTAARPIAAGEELITDYISDTVWGTDRMENLTAHGIVGCRCVACKPSAKAMKHMDTYRDCKGKLTDWKAVTNALKGIRDAVMITGASAAAAVAASSDGSSSATSAPSSASVSVAEAVQQALQKHLLKLCDDGIAALDAVEAEAIVRNATIAGSAAKTAPASPTTPADVTSTAHLNTPLGNLKSFLLLNSFQGLVRVKRELGMLMMMGMGNNTSTSEADAAAMGANMAAAVGVVDAAAKDTYARMLALRLAIVGGHEEHPYMGLCKQMAALLV